MTDAANGVETAKQNAEAVKQEAEAIEQKAEAATKDAVDQVQAGMENTVDQAQAGMENAEEKAQAGMENAEEKAMSGINEGIDTIKEPVRKATPAPETFDTVSSASELKARLDWGEPALTIIDVRDREAFNEERIMGAISLPTDQVVDRAPETLEKNRDIYVYGESDELTSQAAMQLSDAGFGKISALRGGLPAWKAIGGPTEGRAR